MGRDKAWLPLGGRFMIEYVIDALKPVTSEIFLIANSEEYLRLGYPVFADENTGVGPLEAIRLAVKHSSSQYVVLAGCDLPFLRAELFTYLLDSIGQNFAAVPIGADGRFEPLSAVYSIEALSTVTELITQGERKVSRLFGRAPVRFVPFAELTDLPGAALFFENINTPEEYELARNRLHFAL